MNKLEIFFETLNEIFKNWITFILFVLDLVGLLIYVSLSKSLSEDVMSFLSRNFALILLLELIVVLISNLYKKNVYLLSGNPKITLNTSMREWEITNNSDEILTNIQLPNTLLSPKINTLKYEVKFVIGERNKYIEPKQKVKVHREYWAEGVRVSDDMEAHLDPDYTRFPKEIRINYENLTGRKMHVTFEIDKDGVGIKEFRN